MATVTSSNITSFIMGEKASLPFTLDQFTRLTFPQPPENEVGRSEELLREGNSEEGCSEGAFEKAHEDGRIRDNLVGLVLVKRKEDTTHQ